MWRWMAVMTGVLFSLHSLAQKTWDGGGGTEQWSDAANWHPDGVPVPADAVVLDHRWLSSSYTVRLPTGGQGITLLSLRISPQSGAILLELPSGNTADPGLTLTHPAEGLVIDSGGILVNASGASTGSGLSVMGRWLIHNGGRYVHRTPRSNAGLIDKLAIVAGTELGVFEFDVPGTAGYTVSLTGNNFGSLHFRALTAGGAKSYSGSGSGTLTIRGNLLVDTGAQLTSTLTADLVLGGELRVEGRLNLQPSTTGSVARSLRFIGARSRLAGQGSINFSTNFRNIELSREASLTLQRNLSLSQPTNHFICRGDFLPEAYQVEGPGSFVLADSGRIFIRHQEGISAFGDIGPVRTAARQFSKQAVYAYHGLLTQASGNGLPDSISGLEINNSMGLDLSGPVYIRDSIQLLKGKVRSTLQHLLTLGPCKVLSPASRYGPSNEGYESSFVDGPLGIHLMQGRWSTLPIGQDSVFAPVKLLRTDPGQELCILQYRKEAVQDPLTIPPLLRISETEWWSWEQQSSGRLLVQLSARPWSLLPSPLERITAASRQVSWQMAGPVSQATGYHWTLGGDTLAGSTGLALGIVDQAILLPLGFLNFSVREEGDAMILNWEAEVEDRQLRYGVERSGDGILFSEIGSLASAGRSRWRHTWKDATPLPVSYYRVRMGLPGRDIYTKVIRKSRSVGPALIYPNPVKDEININFSFSSSNWKGEVVSVNGTVCTIFVCNTARPKVWVGNLKRGSYFLRLHNGKEWFTLPFTKD